MYFSHWLYIREIVYYYAIKKDDGLVAKSYYALEVIKPLNA